MFRERALARGQRTRSRTKKRRDARFRRLVEEALEQRLMLSANGSDLRTYRFAVAATDEYTAYHGNNRAAALAEVVSIVDGINVVLNAELNVHLDLLDRFELIYGPGNSPDPFTAAGADPIPVLDQNQVLLDSVLGVDGYDIGHVFGTFAGGRTVLAGLGVDAKKARGASGIPVSASSGPDSTRLLDLVLHELSHQLGANHSFNGEKGVCVLRHAPTAYEPGSGTTISSLAGACPAVFAIPPLGDNIQPIADRYFHAGSLAEIVPHLESLDVAGVGTVTPANTPPVIDAGSNYTIPASTPFEVTVSGSDADDPTGDSLRYTIEQMDLGPAQTVDPFPGDNGSSPLFRSFPPAPSQSAGFTRTFPQLSDVLAGTTSKGEYLPSTTRSVNLRATVRDGVGGTNDDDLTISVVNTGRPFRMTTLNTATILTGGTTEPITWDVAGTFAAPISTRMVDIRLSIDGGLTFPLSLAVTENDGSHQLLVPNINVDSARIKIVGIDNIFFDVSDAEFSITSDPSTPGVTVTDGIAVGERGFYASEVGSYIVALNTDPRGSVELSVSADSQSEVSVDGSPFASSVTFIRSDTMPKTVIVRAIDDSVAEGLHTSKITHAIVSGTADYPSGTAIDDLVAKVVDDERPPLVGVDMYFARQSSGTFPTNWNAYDADNPTPATLLDMVRDDGKDTAIDLELKLTNIIPIGGSEVTPMADTLPVHSPSLGGLDDAVRWRNSSSNPQPFANVEAILSDLVPGAKYGVYVFAMETSSVDSINQQVTITGSGEDDPTPFMQVSVEDDILIVNDEDGDSNRLLESYAKVVTADASGTIHVNVRRNDGVSGNRIYLAGLAIQEMLDAPPPLPRVNFTTASQSSAEDVGAMTITAMLSGPARSDVIVPFTLDGTASEGVTADYTITGSPVTIPAGMTSADITITVNDDAEVESRESIIVTMGTPTDAVLGTTIVHTANITDNDIAPADLDFGDAPTSAQSGLGANYPTALPGGARHTTSDLVLGSTVDSEVDGQPTAAADGDGADEDGVRFVSSLVATPGSATTASILITASATGKLDAWIDFTRDGDWTDAGEQLFASSVQLMAGPNLVSFAVPAGASAGETYARFRLSSSGGLGPDGAAADGEVEDYRLTILDGSSPVAGEVDMSVGDVEVTADGSDVVYLHGSMELFRVPGSTLAKVTFQGTAEDNVLRLGNLSSALASPIPLIYDGHAGLDSAILIGSSQSLDLTDVTLTQLSNIEVIDIVGASSNSLTLNEAGVAAATDTSNQLLVIHDADDTVAYAGAGWDVLAPIWVDEGQRHVLTSGVVRVETINSRPYQNPLWRTDVNSMDETSTLDALNIINFLARVGTNPFVLPTPNSPDELSERYYDVNGDGSASSLDALNVINFLAQQSPAESEQLPLLASLPESVRWSPARETSSDRSELDPDIPIHPDTDPDDLSGRLDHSGLRRQLVERAEGSQAAYDDLPWDEDTMQVWTLAIEQLRSELEP